jgi:16S rRNA (uracil1498-N3)-methyltransferase
VEIDQPITLAQVLQELQQGDAANLFAYEKAITPLKFALTSPKVINAKRVNVVIGSEGGFSQEEILQVFDATITPISLGNRILRAETAAIAVVSILTCL